MVTSGLEDSDMCKQKLSFLHSTIVSRITKGTVMISVQIQKTQFLILILALLALKWVPSR